MIRQAEEGPQLETVVIDQQTYRLVDRWPYQRIRDGAWIELQKWRSECPDCGKDFDVTEAGPPRLGHVARRCRNCKRPGVPVFSRRNRRREYESLMRAWDKAGQEVRDRFLETVREPSGATP